MPDFIMLAGLSGAGKSTYAEDAKYEPDMEVLSSDAIREELYGSRAVQSGNDKVFDLMLKRTREALKAGKNVIYDATNLVRKRRVSLLKQLPECRKICKIIWAPYKTCLEARGFTFSDFNDANSYHQSTYIYRMLQSFQTPLYAEGWDHIDIVARGERYSKFNLFRKLSDIPHDNPHHEGSIWSHIVRVIELAKEVTPEDGVHSNFMESALVNLARYHDIGKLYTKGFTNSKGEPVMEAHYYGHQNASAYMTLGLNDLVAPYFMTSIDYTLFISALCEFHMDPFFENPSYGKWLSSLGVNIINIFHELDIKGA